MPHLPDRNQENKQKFSQNLDNLLNLNNRAEKYLNKNFGISLLDLEGNFIWCDTNSERFFENKKKKNTSYNLFELMAPISRASLKKKFNIKDQQGEIFQGEKNVG